MPSGQTHTRIWRRWRWITIILGTAVYTISKNLEMAIAVLPGYYLGLLIDPDWDLPRTNTTAKRRWKQLPIVGYIVVLWINMYGHLSQLTFGGHQSLMTHFPGLSTMIRVLWLLVPTIVVCYLIWPTMLLSLLRLHQTSNISLGLFLGLCMSDLVHIAADIKESYR